MTTSKATTKKPAHAPAKKKAAKNAATKQPAAKKTATKASAKKTAAQKPAASKSTTKRPQAKKQAPAGGAGKPRGRAALIDDAAMQRQLRRLDELFPTATTALVHRDAWELLVATILAAQCTDKLINELTPILFARYPTPAALAEADLEEVQRLIGKVTFFRNKSRHIVATAAAIVERHGGEVPRTMEDLVALPGVARKTANVVLGNAYGIAAGFVVDTHVMRLSNRLGFVAADDPVAIEAAMVERVPRDRWTLVANQIILHGRQTCHARSPKCEGCALAPDCPSAEVAGAS